MQNGRGVHGVDLALTRHAHHGLLQPEPVPALFLLPRQPEVCDGEDEGLELGHVALDPRHEVVDEDLRVEEVAGVGDPVDVKLVPAGVAAKADHLHQLEAGEALLPH